MQIKKVLLVYPYFITGVRNDQVFPPLGIAVLAAVLKQKEIEVMKLDCTFSTREEAVGMAREFKPDITGFYVMTTMARTALEMLEKLKVVNPESVYVAGGPLPSLYPRRFSELFDFVFKGEATRSFPDFCSDYFNMPDKIAFMETIDHGKYPGIFSTRKGMIDSPITHLTQAEIDSYPIPDRSGVDHIKYQDLSFQVNGKKTTSIMTTYGCPFSCDFCSKPVFGNHVRFRSMDSIFEEIKNIVSLGYDSLWIADDLFTFDAGFVKRFCDRMMDEGIRISWCCLSRVDSIPDEIIKDMKNAGCYKVYFGIESGNDSVLKLMNKHIETAVVRTAVEKFKCSGILCAGFFIVGYPGETIETIEETFAFALSLNLDEISFNVPYPLPGSKLYERVSRISDDDWTFENETRFLYESEFDEEWLKRRIKETYDTFEIRK